MSEGDPAPPGRAGSLDGNLAPADGAGFFRTVLERVGDGVFAVDGAGTVVFAGPGMTALLGGTSADVVGESLSTFVPGWFSGSPVLMDLLDGEGVAGLDGARFDLPVVHGDGDHRWLSLSFGVLDHGGTDLLVGTARDVSERHGREEELTRYERIFETVDDGIYILDGNFVITDVNEAVVSMTGYSREELIGSHSSLLASDDLLERAAELSAELLESRRETATIVSEITVESGERLPIETRFSLYPFEDGRYGQVGVIRDISDRKQFEETLTALHSSTRDLLAVDSRAEVSDLIVDTATDVIDLDGAVIYLFDPETNVLRPAASSDGTGGSVDALPTLESGTGLPWQVFVEDEAAVIDGAEVELPAESGLCVPLGDHGVFVAATAERSAVDDDTETLVGLLAASAEEALSRLDRERSIRERDRKLERRNRRLRRLDKVNAIIREIDQVLIEAESIDEISEAVCERLVGSDRFAFAWVGEPNPSGGTLHPRSWAGDEPGYLDDIDLSLDDPREPATRAMASRELTAVTDVGADLRNERWRKAALSRDYRSVIGIPLTHDDITHGVLAVYATRTEAMDAMEPVFAELGETIANAMNAVATKRALLTDSRTELGFRLDADDDVLRRIARRAGGPIEVEGVVPLGDNTTRVFFVTSDAGPEAFRPFEERSVAVETVTLIAERDDSRLFEAVVDGPNVLTTLVDHGAMFRTVRASTDGIRLNVEVPDEADVRKFAEAVRSRYPSAELVSKTSLDRPLRTATEFQYEFEERLTERQMEVLRIAYHRGFYEWPRESTGQEIADSLGVSQPTVNRHLRACERKLFTMLFEGG